MEKKLISLLVLVLFSQIAFAGQKLDHTQIHLTATSASALKPIVDEILLKTGVSMEYKVEPDDGTTRLKTYGRGPVELHFKNNTMIASELVNACYLASQILAWDHYSQNKIAYMDEAVLEVLAMRPEAEILLPALVAAGFDTRWIKFLSLDSKNLPPPEINFVALRQDSIFLWNEHGEARYLISEEIIDEYPLATEATWYFFIDKPSVEVEELILPWDRHKNTDSFDDTLSTGMREDPDCPSAAFTFAGIHDGDVFCVDVDTPVFVTVLDKTSPNPFSGFSIMEVLYNGNLVGLDTLPPFYGDTVINLTDIIWGLSIPLCTEDTISLQILIWLEGCSSYSIKGINVLNPGRPRARISGSSSVICQDSDITLTTEGSCGVDSAIFKVVTGSDTLTFVDKDSIKFADGSNLVCMIAFKKTCSGYLSDTSCFIVFKGMDTSSAMNFIKSIDQCGDTIQIVFHHDHLLSVTIDSGAGFFNHDSSILYIQSGSVAITLTGYIGRCLVNVDTMITFEGSPAPAYSILRKCDEGESIHFDSCLVSVYIYGVGEIDSGVVLPLPHGTHLMELVMNGCTYVDTLSISGPSTPVYQIYQSCETMLEVLTDGKVIINGTEAISPGAFALLPGVNEISICSPDTCCIDTTVEIVTVPSNVEAACNCISITDVDSVLWVHDQQESTQRCFEVSGTYYFLVFRGGSCVQLDSFVVSISEQEEVVDTLIKTTFETAYYDLSTKFPDIIEIVSWNSTSGLSCSDCVQQEISSYVPITYHYSIITSYGCQINGRLVIAIECDDIWIPNAFTPNNDGKNDVFRHYGAGYIDNARIWNRVGELIYQSRGKLRWDGTYRGKLQQPGVYIYVVDVLCNDGNQFDKQGSVTLIR